MRLAKIALTCSNIAIVATKRVLGTMKVSENKGFAGLAHVDVGERRSRLLITFANKESPPSMTLYDHRNEHSKSEVRY